MQMNMSMKKMRKRQFHDFEPLNQSSSSSEPENLGWDFSSFPEGY
jgi:hypothetical protein